MTHSILQLCAIAGDAGGSRDSSGLPVFTQVRDCGAKRPRESPRPTAGRETACLAKGKAQVRGRARTGSGALGPRPCHRHRAAGRGRGQEGHPRRASPNCARSAADTANRGRAGDTRNEAGVASVARKRTSGGREGVRAIPVRDRTLRDSGRGQGGAALSHVDALPAGGVAAPRPGPMSAALGLA